jgi:hypothetical protein|tara:strand:+ start:240 stop:554 length:315 start_codon:yes stop_codon:yes gene_type:complete
MKVENKNAHRAADKHYFFATHVRDGDGSGDDVVMLLLTDKELERAAKRAEKNKEDLPEHFAIIQGSSCSKEKTCCKQDDSVMLDDSEAAQPKKSGGFFSWLMGD